MRSSRQAAASAAWIRNTTLRRSLPRPCAAGPWRIGRHLWLRVTDGRTSPPDGRVAWLGLTWRESSCCAVYDELHVWCGIDAELFSVEAQLPRQGMDERQSRAAL